MSRLLPFALTCFALLWVAAAQAVCIQPCDCVPCPVAHVWPIDSPPCDATFTLQECVDGANRGDAVLIATNGPISESISFAKSLTLGAAQGFTPVFSAGNFIQATPANASSTVIDIQGLTLQDGYIQVSQEGSGSLTLAIRNNTIESETIPFSNGVTALQLQAIEIQALSTNGTKTGPISFVVSGNEANLSPPPSCTPSQLCYAGGINFFSDGSSSSGLVAGNAIAMSATGAPIFLSSGDGDLTVDVLRNRISGIGYDAGVELFSEGAGTLTARILDNLVSGEHSSSGDGAITADAASDSTGAIQFAIANNTVARNDTAIRVRREGGSVAGSIANNAVTGNFYGLDVDDALAPVVSDHDNLFFGNVADLASGAAGPGSVFADPLYASSNDYHLKAGSPAIGAGDDSAVPATDLDGSPITDLDGSPRIQGAHVDIGAYETAPEPATMLSAGASLMVLASLAQRSQPSHARASTGL